MLYYLFGTILSCFFSLSFLFLFNLVTNSSRQKIIKVLIPCFVMFIYLALFYMREYTNRYIYVSDEHIRFNSFRFKRMRNPISLNVRYENIISIKPKKLPLFGLWGIIINAQNIPHEITLSICYHNHKKMFWNICNESKKHNSNVIIYADLKEYLEKNYE